MLISTKRVKFKHIGLFEKDYHNGVYYQDYSPGEYYRFAWSVMVSEYELVGSRLYAREVDWPLRNFINETVYKCKQYPNMVMYKSKLGEQVVLKFDSKGNIILPNKTLIKKQ